MTREEKRSVGVSRKRTVVLMLASLVLVACLSALLWGCAEEAEPPAEEPGVAVLEVETPLRSPVWSPGEEALFALGRGEIRLVESQLVKVDVNREGFNPDAERPQAIASSEELEVAAGENLALGRDREPDKIYIPIPERDEVLVMEKDDLLKVRTFRVGLSPSRVALARSPGASDTLFALSEEGSTVAVVDLLGEKEVVAVVDVEAGRGAQIEAFDTGAEDAFWLAGSEGIRLYEGPSFERVAAMPIEAGALAVDAANPERAYVSELSSGRVIAVELTPDGDLEVVAEAEVEGRVMYLQAEEGLLYAVTPDALLAFDAESLETLETVEFDRYLDRRAPEGAEPSGVAVGEDYVFVTLAGEPFLLQIEKPQAGETASEPET